MLIVDMKKYDTVITLNTEDEIAASVVAKAAGAWTKGDETKRRSMLAGMHQQLARMPSTDPRKPS